MSGHSRWAGIKHKKAVIDKKKGKVFTKIAREISVAAKIGGGSPETNPRLRKAIEDARAANMPQDNVKKAIQRGTGELPGLSYEDVTFEGYGPGGVAVFVEGTTDNKNRTFPEIRKIFSDFGGSLGESGCVAWIFEQKGFLTVLKSSISEEKIMDLAIESGAEDIKSDGDETYEITTSPEEFESVKSKLSDAGLQFESAEITLLPKNSVPVSGSDAQKNMDLMEALDEHEDVKSSYANFDINPEDLPG